MARRRSSKRFGPESRPSQLKRKESTRDQLKLVIIACEGKRTEPAYFRKLFDLLKKRRQLSKESCVIALHQHTDPPGVLEDLLKHQTKSGFTYKDYDLRWIVIDRDPEQTYGGGHQKVAFNEAIFRGHNNKPKVNVAWSNPSFEIWFLLHFEYRNTAIDRRDLNKRLDQLLGEPYSKSDSEIFNALEHRLPTAIKNAKKLEDDALKRGIEPAETNPGTTVHKLVKQLLVLSSINSDHPD